MDMCEETTGSWAIATPTPVDGPFTVAQHVAHAISVLDAAGLDDAVILDSRAVSSFLAGDHPYCVRER